MSKLLNLTMASKSSTPPKIWKEFEIENQKYWIQDAEECHQNLVIHAMAYEFTRDEPLSIHSKLLENTELIEKIRKAYIEILHDGFCIVCITKDNNKSVLVGFQCFEVSSLVEAHKSWRLGVNLMQYMLKRANISSKLTSQQYLEDRGLYVFPEYRQKGIAAHLLSCWSLVCKHAGQELVIGTFSSKYSQAAARKAGFIEMYYCMYEEIRKELPSEIPLGVENHTKGPSVIPGIGSAYCIKSGNQKVQIILGLSPWLLISDVESVQFLLSSNEFINKSYEYDFLTPWLGTGLLLSKGEKWRNRRKLLTSAFHYNALLSFIEIFNKQSKKLILKLEALKDDIDIFPIMKLYSLDVVCETIMDTSVNAQEHINSEYVHSVDEIVNIIFNRLFSVIKRWNFLYRFSQDYQDEKKCIKILHGYTNNVIKNRRNELYGAEKVTNKKLNLLDILLTSTVNEKYLTNEEIREEVDTFMFAGHDTVTSVVSFVLYSLSKHLPIQEKVFQELQDVVGNDNKSLSYQDVQNLRYLDQVVKESMRMYPPVAFILRKLKEDAVFNNHILPKNLIVSVFIYGLHHHKDLYPNPEVFDPDRFNEENCKNRSLYAFIPFSMGIRNCIGNKFAMLEVKFTVANILRKLKILPVANHQIQLNAFGVLKSDNGLLVRLEKRRY
ncbi:hypothetical protein RN001_008403 [Aquatica leii]|uniref:Cytochrome P450 n=1 Tax=Aquatica leii TaxID=1421715 RepID=A0AAN7P9K9_9COLE|nr:hypothetical protein RN001_008403 [Aquatica leii]